MGKKLIVTIEDKESGKNKVDINFDFFPAVDLEDESKNSKILVDCFVAINEALGLTPKDDVVHAKSEGVKG